MNADLSGLKTTEARRRTLNQFARAVYEGKISLDAAQDVATFTAAALAIAGIGPWTAKYMALKCLRHTDAFPASDLVLARILEQKKLGTLETLSPWRGYAAALLWRDHAYSENKQRSTL